MNDRELDELLESWKSPAAPSSLRERVRTRFASRQDRPGLKSWLKMLVPGRRMKWATAMVAGVAAFSILITGAFPQAAQLQPPPPVELVSAPYAVDSEYTRYAEDGTSQVVMYTSSYSDDRGERLISRSIASGAWGIFVGHLMEVVGAHASAIHSLAMSAEQKERIARSRAMSWGAITGCGDHSCYEVSHSFYEKARGDSPAPCVRGNEVGRETILNYATVAVRPPGDPRMTLWVAPELSCFALRITREAPGPDGKLRLVSKKQALAVHFKH